MHMIIVWALSWWYGSGWKQCLLRARDRMASTFDYFSIGLLAKTLFSPYKQISADKIRGPINVQLRAFFDRLVSRVIGAIVRTILIVTGLLWIGVQAAVSLVVVIAWAAVPFAPLVGFILLLSGWVPTWR
jgi:hypothetical protein